MIIFDDNYIDVSKASIADLIKHAYALSHSHGLGLLHFEPGDLDDETLKSVANNPHNRGGVTMIHMDYIKGRSVKMTIYLKGDKKYILNRWYGHSPADLERFLTETGVK
jgi:hypothetical protein